MKKRLYLTFFAAALFASVSHAQDTKKLDAFIKSVVREFDLPSLTIQVVNSDSIVFTGNYGIRAKEGELKADENTLYAIASLSKAFTAASIGMLVDEGKLDWKDKVVDHLPWFALHDEYVTKNMTIEDLLCHRSGLMTFDGDLLWYGTSYSREEAIKRLSSRPLTHGFREEFGYQNLMFMTAGEVIEEVSGMTWDDFVSKRILMPLGMNRTTSSFDAFASDRNKALPTLDNEEILMLSYDNCGATAALNSTSYDMGKWLRFWLNEGIVDGDTLLQPETVQKIWNLHTPLGTGGFDEKNRTHFKGYGQGWFLMDYNNEKIIHHGGGLPGYISKAMLSPEGDIGMIALTNSMTSVPTMLMYAVLDWKEGKDLEPWKEQFLGYQKAGKEREKKAYDKRMEAKKDNPKLMALSEYVGTYEDEMYGRANIRMGKDGLSITLEPTKVLFSGTMVPFADHAFKFEFFDPFLPFGIANFEVENGKVNGFTIDLPNNDFHFYKLNFKRVQ